MANALFVPKIGTIPKETKNEVRGLLQTRGEFKVICTFLPFTSSHCSKLPVWNLPMTDTTDTLHPGEGRWDLREHTIQLPLVGY
jgi:hypothetical protein